MDQSPSQNQQLVLKVPTSLYSKFGEFSEEYFGGNKDCAFNYIFDMALEYDQMKLALIDLGSLISRIDALEEDFRDIQMRAAENEEPIKSMTGDTFKPKK